jgi:formamidopyrimidine-DNA glycosylase
VKLRGGKTNDGNIYSISTYGKILLFELENNYFLVIRFGMSGFITTDPNIKYNNITLVSESAGDLYINDHRNFGSIYLISSDILNEKLSLLGPDILDPRFDFEIFKNSFDKYQKRSPNKYICQVLLEQEFICGVGNYLRAEILYMAKIYPYTKLIDIRQKQLTKLFYYLYHLPRYYAKSQIPNNLLNNKDKQNLIYNLKYIPDDFNRPFFVYRQKYDINGKKIIKDQINNRSLYWVKY